MMKNGFEVLTGDSLAMLGVMPDCLASCCVTSPPYFGLRDYGHEGQIGLEPTVWEYVERLVAVFREVRRVLRDDGTLWLNLGDSYASQTGSGPQGKNGDRADRAFTASSCPRKGIADGLKNKDLIGIPWRVAFALQADGWYLRQDIIWSKPNPMPESVKDRCTKAHEYVFLLSKSERYHFDGDAIAEPATGRDPGNVAPNKHAGKRFAQTHDNLSAIGARATRNARSVWQVATQPCKEAHFAVMPHGLAQRCILAGCPAGGVVLDPFVGSGTTGMVAALLGRNFVGCEINPAFADMARRRIGDVAAQSDLFTSGPP